MKICIADEFTDAPGARYRTDGPKSGEEFFEDLLDSRFIQSLEAGESLIIDFDGTWGYASSFISEAFGRLSKKHGKEKVTKNLVMISQEDPDLPSDVLDVVKNPFTEKNK
tara:strand:- start:1313 stop:1642 length:330 start_codon:yes stop_codon:yes gene_type:complete